MNREVEKHWADSASVFHGAFFGNRVMVSSHHRSFGLYVVGKLTVCQTVVLMEKLKIHCVAVGSGLAFFSVSIRFC